MFKSIFVLPSGTLDYLSNNTLYVFDSLSKEVLLLASTSEEAPAIPEFSIKKSSLEATFEQHPLTKEQESEFKANSNFVTSGSKWIFYLFLANQIREAGSISLLGAAYSAEMIQMLRYVNTSYPANMIYYFNSTLSSPVSFAFGLKASFMRAESHVDNESEIFIDDSGPYQYYEQVPFFIHNIQEDLIATLLVFSVAVLCKIVTKLAATRKGRLSDYMNRIDKVLFWNYLLVIVFSCYTRLSFFATLNMKYQAHETAFGKACTAIAIVVLVVILASVVSIFLFLKAASKLSQQSITLAYPRIGLLFDGFKKDSLMQKFFVPFMLTRTTVFSCILVAFESSPTFQLSFIIALNTIVVAYQLVYRPLKSRLELVFQIIYDCLVLLSSIFMVTLHGLQQQPDEKYKHRMRIGSVFVYLNTALIVAGLLSSLIDTMQSVFTVIRSYKARKDSRRVHRIEIVSSLEQISSNTHSKSNSNQLNVFRSSPVLSEGISVTPRTPRNGWDQASFYQKSSYEVEDVFENTTTDRNARNRCSPFEGALPN